MIRSILTLIGSIFTLILFTLIVDAGPVATSQPPLIFSWYMTPFYTYSHYGDPDAVAIAGYKHDIQDAQASGIDGFALYVGNQQYLFNNTKNMFEAAKELHDADPSNPAFQLFLAPAGGNVASPFPGTNINHMVYFMEAFANHPNYYHYNGNAVLGSFLGLDQQSAWTLVFNTLNSHGIKVFFTPSIFNANLITAGGTALTTWAQTYIGSVNFWTGDVPSTDIAGNNSLANIMRINGKPVVGNVSGANYWSLNNSASAGIYFEHDGGEGPEKEWINAISLNPIFVIETTWNDYTESYTTPVADPTKASTGYGISALLKPHAGYSELRKRYAQWYKTGIRPTVTKDLLIYFYRTHAQNLIASNDTRHTTFHPSTIPDKLFVTTELTAPATLKITTGGVITTYSVPAGVTYTQIPFHAGAQQFQITRGGATIISTSGEAILSSITKYNYEYTTGFAYAP